MTTESVLKTLVCVGLAVFFTAPVSSAAQDLPNIIIVYADDLGYGDLSAYNPNAGRAKP